MTAVFAGVVPTKNVDAHPAKGEPCGDLAQELYPLAGTPSRALARRVFEARRCNQMCNRGVAGRLKTGRDNRDGVPRFCAAGERVRDV